MILGVLGGSGLYAFEGLEDVTTHDVTTPWPDSVGRVSAFLRETGAEARIEEFAEGTPTAQAAADAVGCDLAQIVKSLVFLCDG